MKTPASLRSSALVLGALFTIGACSDPGPPIEQPDLSMPPVVYASCRPKSPMPPACGTGTPGADLLSFDADPAQAQRRVELETKARRIDRVYSVVAASTTSLSTEVSVYSPAGRAAVTAFAEGTGDDFQATTGVPLASAVDAWAKVAGAYAGVGVAADAFRYGSLRELGLCAELDRARQLLVADLDALHLATAITGVPGVIARGFARKDVPGAGQAAVPTPLFDSDGKPLPAEKSNGTWRSDASGGQYPSYVWEDSCSVDQLVGWVIGYAAAWEVIADDPSFDAALKARLQADAAALARSLMVVRDSGYDLEIRDADGRRTLFGILSHKGVDKFYVPEIDNGFNALMALGIVAGLAYVAEDSEIFTYLEEQLVVARALPQLARDKIAELDFGTGTNFSGYNMAFAGGFLASRYLCNPVARATVQAAVKGPLYDHDGMREPAEQKQTLYDFVYALAAAGATAFSPMSALPDGMAIARGIDSLAEYPDAPFWNTARINCDATEVQSLSCTGDDGQPIELLSSLGWNEEVVATAPLPMRLRPPSNYYWRSNPYAVNGEGDGSQLFSGVDFRFVYWLGRWAR